MTQINHDETYLQKQKSRKRLYTGIFGKRKRTIVSYQNYSPIMRGIHQTYAFEMYLHQKHTCIACSRQHIQHQNWQTNVLNVVDLIQEKSRHYQSSFS